MPELEALRQQFPAAQIESDYFRLDFDEGPEGANDPKAQDLYHEVCDALKAAGFQFVQPYIEHDCISGKIEQRKPRPSQSDGNEIRKCAHCQNYFEVPIGYPPADGWKCARCLHVPPLPLCQHREKEFRKCLLCGCLLTGPTGESQNAQR